MKYLSLLVICFLCSCKDAQVSTSDPVQNQCAEVCPQGPSGSNGRDGNSMSVSSNETCTTTLSLPGYSSYRLIMKKAVMSSGDASITCEVVVRSGGTSQVILASPELITAFFIM